MAFQTILYFSSILLTCLLTGFLAWYAWKHDQVPASRAYMRLTLSECFFALAEILSTLSPSSTIAMFWFQMRYLAGAFMGVFWLMFALEYSGRREWLTKRLLAGLFIIPFVTQVLLWSNSLHGLWIKQEAVFYRNGPLWIADVTTRIAGLGYLTHMFYTLFLTLTGIALIFLTAWKMRREFIGQALLLIGAGLTAFTLTMNSLFNFLPEMGFNPFTPGIGLSVLLIALSVFRFEFLKRAPAQESDSRISRLDAQEKYSLAVFILIFIMFTSGFAVAGYLTYQNYEKQFRAQVESQLSSITELKVNEMVDWRAGRMADAETFHSNPAFAALAQRSLENPDDTLAKEQLQTWLDIARNSYDYDRIFLLDTAGVERVSSPATPEPVAAHLTQESAAIIRSHQITFLDFHRDSPTEPIHLALLVPIYAEGGQNRPLGLLVLRIDPETYLYPYIRQWPAPSQSAETLLVRREGGAALFLNPLRFEPDAALELRIPLENTETVAVKAVLGQEGVLQGTDYRGMEVIGHAHAVPDSPWFLVTRIDSAEVYAPLNERLWQTILFFGMLVLASGAGLAFVWRQQQVSYYRTQVEAEDALRESREHLALVLEGSQLGSWDWDIETGKVQRNARWAEMLGYTLAEVELNVKQGTDLQHPDDRAAAWKSIEDHLEGRTEMHKIEYRMRAKDGQYKWILDQARVVKRDAQGKPLRMSGTHTDITERKQAEDGLVAAEKMAQELLAASSQSRLALLSMVEDQKRTEDTLRQQNQILGALQNTTLELASQLDLKTLLENIVKRACALVGTSASLLDLVDPVTHQLMPQIGMGVLEVSLHLPPVQPGEGLTGIVWQTGEILVVPDYDQWSGRLDKTSRSMLGSVIGVPLLSGADVLGVLVTGSAYGVPHHFDPGAIEILNQFARLATVAVQNARLFSNLQSELTERKRAEEVVRNRNRMLLATHNIMLKIGTELHLPILLSNILEQAQSLLDADRGGGIYLYESGGDALRLVHGTGINQGRDNITIQVDEGVVGRVYQTSQPLIIDNYSDWKAHATILVTDPPSTVMGVPLVLNAKVFGVLTLIANSQLRKFIDQDMQQAEIFAAQAAVAIQNAQLYQQARQEIAERVQVEEELRESKDLFETVVENIPLTVFLKEAKDLRFVMFNRAGEELMGYDRKALLGKNNLDLFPPEQAAHLIAKDREVLDGEAGMLDIPEEPIQTAGKGERLLHTRKVRIREADGTTKYLLGISEDITERKHTEREQRALLEIMQGLTFSKDMDEFLALVHLSLGSVIKAENFFVALYDASSGLFTDVYSADQHDQPLVSSKQEKTLTAYIFRTRAPFLSTKESFKQLVDAGEVELVGTDSPSFLGVPLIASGQAIGVMVVQDYEQEHVYSERDKQFLMSIAGHVALAVQRKRAEAALQLSERIAHQTAEQLRVVNQISATITTGLDLEQLMQTIYEECLQIGYADTFYIALYDDATGVLSFAFSNSHGTRISHPSINIRETPNIANHSIETRKTLYLPDIHNMPAGVTYHAIFPTPSLTQSYMSVPLILSEQVMGVLSMQSIELNAYSPEQIQTFELMATQVAIAIQNSQLYGQVQQELVERKRAEQEIRQRVVELEMLYESGLALSQQSSPNAIGERLIALLEQKMDWHHTAIRLYHPQNQTLELLAFNQPDLKSEAIQSKTKERFARIISKPGEGFSGWAIQNDQIVRSGDVSNDPRYVETYPGLHSGLYVPIKSSQGVIGVISIESEIADAFTEADERLAATLANQAAVAIENVNLTIGLEQRVKERTAEVQDLYENAPNGYHSLDAKGLIVMINQTELDWLGYTREELVGIKKHRDLFTPQSQKTFDEKYPHFMAQGWIENLEFEVIRKDGSTFPILLNATAIYDANGKYLHSRSTIFDLTVRKHAEEAARKLSQAIENSPISVVITNRDGAIEYVNPGFCEATGYTRNEAVGLNPRVLKSGLHPPEFYRAMWATLLAGQPWRGELCNKRKNGEVFWEYATIAPIKNEYGQITHYVAVKEDITERKEAGEALRESRDELSAANVALEKAARLKDEFLASMSHELRTPLTGILGFSEALQLSNYGPLSEKQSGIIKNIEDSGRHLLELINDILDLSKIEAGKLDLQLAPCALADICKASLQLTKGMAQQKKQMVHYAPASEPIMLHADTRRLKQILVNLLGNAIKFTPEKGELGLEVQVDEDNRRVKLTVWDKGIGIEAGNMHKLFKPFVQLDSSLAREYSGTGLGLALVQRLTEMHNGGIEVESVFGEGSRFTVSLPWSPQNTTPNFSTPLHKTAAHSGTKIQVEQLQFPLVMIADDNEMVLQMIADFLETERYRVVKVRSGAELLERVAELHPDIMLVDIQMPGMDGLETIRRIRAHTDSLAAATPVIAITALAMPSDRELCLRAGANDYMSKPVKLQEIARTIQKELARKKT